MGIIRFLLAISIVFTHLGVTFGYSPMSGTLAITAFFIVSGFYMALILNEKYIGKNKSYSLFIINRFLRIYPLYWIVLFLATIVYILFAGNLPNNPLLQFFNNYQLLSGFNLLKQIGIDVVRLIFLIPNAAYFFPRHILVDPLIIGPAWTLGLELLFYLIVPFIARRSLKIILLTTAVCFFLRFITYHYFIVMTNGQGYVNPAFSPSILLYFLLGIIAYKSYAYLKKYTVPPLLSKLLLVYIAAYTFFYSFIPGDSQKIYLVSLLICIPILFKAFSRNKVDRFLGELSYPIYISHIVIINTVVVILPQINKNYLHVFLFLLCIFVGIILYQFIELPIDRYRKSRLKY